MNLLIGWLFFQCIVLSVFAEEYKLSQATDADGIITKEYVEHDDHTQKLRTEVFDPSEPPTKTIFYYDVTEVSKVTVERRDQMAQVDVLEIYIGPEANEATLDAVEVRPFTNDRVIIYADITRTYKVKEVFFPTSEFQGTTTIYYDSTGIETFKEIENPEDDRFIEEFPRTSTNGGVRKIYRGTKLEKTLEGIEVTSLDFNTITTYKDESKNIKLQERRMDSSGDSTKQTVFYYDETSANNVVKFCNSDVSMMGPPPVTTCRTGTEEHPEFLYLEEYSSDYTQLTRYADEDRQIISQRTLREHSETSSRRTVMFYDETSDNVILSFVVESHSSGTEGYVREVYKGPPENAELEHVEVGSADHESATIYKDLARTIKLEVHTYSQDATHEIRTTVFFDGTTSNTPKGKYTIESRPIGSSDNVEPIKEVYSGTIDGTHQLIAVEVPSDDPKGIIVYESFAQQAAGVKYQFKSADRDNNPRVRTRVTYDTLGSTVVMTEREDLLEKTYTVEYENPAANEGVLKVVYHGTEEAHTLAFKEVVGPEGTITTYIDEAKTNKIKKVVVDSVQNPTLTVTTFYDEATVDNIILITKEHAAASPTEPAYKETFNADGVTLQTVAVTTGDNKVITVYSDAEREIKITKTTVNDEVNPTVIETVHYTSSGDVDRTEREDQMNRKYSIEYPPRDGNGGVKELYEGSKDEHRFECIEVTSYNNERVTTYVDFDRTIKKMKRTIDNSVSPPRTTTVYYDKTPENRPKGFTVEYALESTSDLLVKEFYSGTVDYPHLGYIEVPSPDRRIITTFADLERTIKHKETEVDNLEHPNLITTTYYDRTSQNEVKKEFENVPDRTCRVEYPTQMYFGKKTKYYELVEGKKRLLRIEVVSEDNMSMTKFFTPGYQTGPRTEYYIASSDGQLHLYRTELLGGSGGPGGPGGPDAGPDSGPYAGPDSGPDEGSDEGSDKGPDGELDGPDGELDGPNDPNKPNSEKTHIKVEDCNGGYPTENNARTFECNDYATGFKVRTLVVGNNYPPETRTIYYDISPANREVKKVIEHSESQQYMVEYTATQNVGVVKAFYNSTDYEPILNRVEVSSVDGKTVTVYGGQSEGGYVPSSELPNPTGSTVPASY